MKSYVQRLAIPAPPPGRSGTPISSEAWAHPPKPGWHLVEWGCELVGTFVLVVGGLSAVAIDFGQGSPVARALPSTSARLLLTGLVFAGCGSLVAISPVGRRSGAHLNPAVTVAFWLRGHVARHDLGGYIGAQCLGAAAGAAMFRLVWAGRAASVGYGVTHPGGGVGPAGAAAIETAMTGALLLTIFAFVSNPRTARWTPLAVWLVVATLVWQGAPYTGTSLNPARSLGPALVAGHWADYWVYVVGPILASVVVAALWKGAGLVTLTAKLFHDPAYRTSLGSHLPVRPHPHPVMKNAPPL